MAREESVNTGEVSGAKGFAGGPMRFKNKEASEETHGQQGGVQRRLCRKRGDRQRKRSGIPSAIFMQDEKKKRGHVGFWGT